MNTHVRVINERLATRNDIAAHSHRAVNINASGRCDVDCAALRKLDKYRWRLIQEAPDIKAIGLRISSERCGLLRFRRACLDI